VVLLGLLPGRDSVIPLELALGALALEAMGGDKALDLGHLDGGLLALTTRHLTLEAVLLLHLVSLVESEKLPDASGTLGTQTAGDRGLSEAGELALALADDDKVEDLDVRGHNAATDGLTLALTLPALAVARGALLEKKADALSGHHTLLHGEPLLVISARDLEDIPLELVTEDIANDLLVHALVVELAPATPQTIAQNI